MAGESRISYGYGYTFDATGIEEQIEEAYYDGTVPRDLLVMIDPFHGANNKRFAVVAKSTYFSGDPQEGDTPLGLQKVSDDITDEEDDALEAFLRKFNSHLVAGRQIVISITADV